jgi:hypothetical protein
MAPKITKEQVIAKLQEQYAKSEEIPKSTNFSKILCSDNTVRKLFGSWNNALITAGIPIRKNKPLKINCDQCDIEFIKQVKEIKKSKNHFCSHSCSAIFNNKNRVMTEETKNKISNTLKITALQNEIPIEPKSCIGCEKIFIHSYRKTCSADCLKLININNGKISGAKGGRASQASQPRRSKGEILFFNLCVSYFWRG